jgi:hypothetical protein
VCTLETIYFSYIILIKVWCRRQRWCSSDLIFAIRGSTFSRETRKFYSYFITLFMFILIDGLNIFMMMTLSTLFDLCNVSLLIFFCFILISFLGYRFAHLDEVQKLIYSAFYLHCRSKWFVRYVVVVAFLSLFPFCMVLLPIYISLVKC